MDIERGELLEAVGTYELRQPTEAPHVVVIQCALCGRAVGGGLHNFIRQLVWPLFEDEPPHCRPTATA